MSNTKHPFNVIKLNSKLNDEEMQFKKLEATQMFSEFIVEQLEKDDYCVSHNSKIKTRCKCFTILSNEIKLSLLGTLISNLNMCNKVK